MQRLLVIMVHIVFHYQDDYAINLFRCGTGDSILNIVGFSAAYGSAAVTNANSISGDHSHKLHLSSNTTRNNGNSECNDFSVS